MQQKPIKTVPQVLNLATTAMGGASEHEVAIGIVRNTGARIAVERQALREKQDEYLAARDEMRRCIEESQRMFEVALGVILPTRDVLKVYLGIHHSSTWGAIGFKGSMRMPRTWLGVFTVLEGFVDHLKNNPAHQVQELNVTMAYLKQTLGQAKAAYLAVLSQKAILGKLKRERDRRFITLRDRLRGLFKELSMILEPNDHRFISYGFLVPGARQKPAVPENVQATPVSATAVKVEWDRSERAERYRLWVKVEGVDQEARLVKTRVELDAVIDDLPPNSEMELSVSAVNNKGESRRSKVVRVKTPQATDR